jgi:Tfp pilus assembly protein PilO
MYISPLWAEMSDIRAKKENYDNVLSKIEELKAERDSALNAYDSISPNDLAKLEKMIPVTFDSVKFLNDMGALSSKHGLSMDTFASTAGGADMGRSVNSLDNGGYKSNSVTLHVAGTLPQFINFLKDLESSLRIIDLTSLSMAPAPSTQKNVTTLQYTLVLTVYSLK